MPWFAVGDFHDNITRLLCPCCGYLSQDEAETRITTILSMQRKPHHVSYRTVEATSWQKLASEGVKI